MLDTFPDHALRLFVLLALVTLAGCATNVPTAQLSIQPAIGPGAPSQPLHTSALDTCPDGLVVLMQSTASQAPPYKVTYRRQPDGCYVTRDFQGQTITSRAFFGAVLIRGVRNPEVVEAGFRSVVLDDQKSNDFTLIASRWGGDFNVDTRLSNQGRLDYNIDGSDFKSLRVYCTSTTVGGRQFFENSLVFSQIPDTQYIFLAEVSSPTPSSAWGSDKIVHILALPQKASTH
jgi:hypothetical protein